MRLVRLLLAGAAVTGSFAMSAPAQAQPCIPDNPVAFVCALTEDYTYRGVSSGFYTSGPAGAVGVVVAGVGCYYPNGPRYFVHVYTSHTGRLVNQTLPVGGVPCV